MSDDNVYHGVQLFEGKTILHFGISGNEKGNF